MKTRIAIIAGITSIAVLSFAFSSLDTNHTTKSPSKSSSIVSQNEPVGGFVAEEIKK